MKKNYKYYLILLVILFLVQLKAQNNCNSSMTICSSTSNTPNGIGIQELNISNKGCLSIEHNSTWYNISILQSGTLTFTINPNINSQDFDFGVWSGTNCPPNTNPIRCSWAEQSGNGNTGLNNSSSDLSEDENGDQFVRFINVIAGQSFTVLVDNFANNNEFTISFGGTSIISCIALPIDITLFECKTNSDNIELKWITLNESNNKGFYIENSIDGLIFNPIAFIKGSNSNYLVKYQFLDYFPNINNYYRIKQVDYNDNINYSNIVNCNINDIKIKYEYYTLLGQPLSNTLDNKLDCVYIEKMINGNHIKINKLVK